MRLKRFSIRAAFALMAAASLFAWWLSGVVNRRDCIATLHDVGAVVRFPGNWARIVGKPNDIWYRGVRAEKFPDPTILSSVISIDAARSTIQDGDLIRISQLPQLDWLNLSTTAVTDAGVEHLSGAPRLVHLLVRDTSITDRSIPAIVRMDALLLIDVNGTNITDEGIAELESARPDLHVIRDKN